MRLPAAVRTRLPAAARAADRIRLPAAALPAAAHRNHLPAAVLQAADRTLLLLACVSLPLWRARMSELPRAVSPDRTGPARARLRARPLGTTRATVRRSSS